jgi:hypothetical protein
MGRYDAILVADQPSPEPHPQPQPASPEYTPPPITVDPRPDLADDSELWTRLLELAEAEDRMFAGTLHGFRCMGTRIKRGQKGYILRPDIDPTGDTAWTSQNEYAEMKEEWLRPHISKIANLLRCL